MTFETWCLAVDAEIHRQVGLSRDDIDDWHYRNSFDYGMDPKEVARDALENAGFPYSLNVKEFDEPTI